MNLFSGNCITSYQNSIEPKCLHFRICGGCQFQHIPYNEQLIHKEAFVSSCFGRQVEPIIPCEPAWRYRNKMEFSFAQSKKGEKFLGLMKHRGRVENLEECYLTTPWFLEVVKSVRIWWLESNLNAYYPPANQGLLRTLTLREGRRSKEKMIILTVSEEPFEEMHISSFVEAVPKVDSLILRKQIIQKKTPTHFEEEVLAGKNHIHEILYSASGRPYYFRIRGNSFFQPNTIQAETIYQKTIDYAHLSGDDNVCDLYCGTGSLGIFASHYAGKVLGIEIVKEAVQDARANLVLNAISNMEVVEGAVSEKLDSLSFSPSTLLVDPPRAGLGAKTIDQLNQLKAKKIIYVSCNPQTQAVDCQALTEYEILYLQPIDQFPHTVHVENIAYLRRKA